MEKLNHRLKMIIPKILTTESQLGSTRTTYKNIKDAYTPLHTLRTFPNLEVDPNQLGKSIDIIDRVPHLSNINSITKQTPNYSALVRSPLSPNITPVTQATRSQMIQDIDNVIQKSISSDRSILAMSAVKASRFLRVTQGISLFIRENWFIIRPIMIAVAAFVGFLVLGPAIGLAI